MVWVDKKGKQAMFVQPAVREAPTLRLRGQIIAQPEEHAYQGTMLSAGGEVTAKLERRIAAGHRRMGDICRARALVRGMAPLQARKYS